MTTKRRVNRGGVGGHEPRTVIESRAQRVWELAAAGRTQCEIANDVDISQPAVSKILQRVADVLADGRRQDHERQRERALAREQFLYREAIRAFERSQRDKTRRRQRQVTDAEGTTTQAVVEADVTARDGDPRFLEQAGRAQERTAALHGLTGHGGRAHRTAHSDTAAARDRLAGKLGRLALASASKPVPDKPE